MNRTNILWAVAIITLATLLIHAQPQHEAQPAPYQFGRFQIYSLSYTTFVSSSVTPLRGNDVFRIDAETGTTWKYVNLVKDDAKISDRWVKIDEPR